METSSVDPVHMVDTTGFKADLMVNDHVIELNNFVQNYISAVLYGMISALGAIPGEVVLVMDNTRDIEIYVDNKKVEIRKRFVKDIVGSTVRGLVSPLKGIFFLDRVIIRTRRRTL